MVPKVIGVTGACGYIGGAICYELKKSGYKVVGLDRVKRPYLLPYMDTFYHCDFDGIQHMQGSAWLDCDAIIHCAGTSLVGPSVTDPAEYYNNNVAKTISLMDWCVTNKKHFLFSSSASVYKTQNRPITEEDPLQPLSPYARTKAMIEQIASDFCDAYDFKATIFRYFNACGAIGDVHGNLPNDTHIFPRLFENDVFEINGNDFETRDGTCIRDYIHITDIAQAHIKAIENSAFGVYNLGSNNGYTNLEIANAVKKPYTFVERREGDADCLVADNTMAKAVIGWSPLTTLPMIIKDLKEWYGSKTYSGLRRQPA